MRFKEKRPDLLERLVSSQLRSMNSALARQKTLKELLNEEKPSSVTKSSDKYYFDKEILGEIGKILPRYKHSDLKLPIYLHVDLGVPDQCYINDRIQAGVIKKIGNLEEGYRFRKEKLWIPKVIGKQIMRKYPSITQYFWLP